LMKSYTVYEIKTVFFLLSEIIKNFIEWISFFKMDTKI